MNLKIPKLGKCKLIRKEKEENIKTPYHNLSSYRMISTKNDIINNSGS